MVKQLAGAERDEPGDSERPRRRIPEATVARLPLYLRSLLEAAEAKTTTVSSERLAEMAGVNAAKVRKDFSYLGSYGTRGVGYDVEYLLFQISKELGLTQDWPVVIVGIGNLGAALANYRGFSARGFRIVALVDADPAKCGKDVGGLVVEPLRDLPRIVAERGVAIGIIATPAAAAQEVAELLVSAGVTSVLNFAPIVIAVPPGVWLPPTTRPSTRRWWWRPTAPAVSSAPPGTERRRRPGRWPSSAGVTSRWRSARRGGRRGWPPGCVGNWLRWWARSTGFWSTSPP